nr:hypothetical protein [Tanacetum cinerariifolium]
MVLPMLSLGVSLCGVLLALDDIVRVTKVGSERASYDPSNVVVALSVGKKGDGSLPFSAADEEAAANPSEKPQRKARSGSKFSSNNITLKLNLSKIQSSGTSFAQRSKPNPSKVKDKSPGTNFANFPKDWWKD